MGLTPAQLTTKATNYFKALYTHPEVSGVGVTATYTANSGNGASVVLNATGTMPTDFMKLAGQPTVALNVSVHYQVGQYALSRCPRARQHGFDGWDNKMKELKIATKQLIDDFYAMANGNDDVYISIVPFSKDVNVGTSNKNATWLRWTEWNEMNGRCSSSWYVQRATCQNAGRTWNAASKNTWQGCVMDRDQDYDVAR